ncbi:mCG66860 [Mus musculus]|jgi:hypothetical protein|nr:mCG66860 [Mus musculus]
MTALSKIRHNPNLDQGVAHEAQSWMRCFRKRLTPGKEEEEVLFRDAAPRRLPISQ